MALTVTAINGFKPQEKPYKKADAAGLYLEINPNGRKYWRYRYRWLGKQKLLAIGVYPEISLSDARERRDKARKLLADNIDPSAERKKAKRAARIDADNTYEAIAREWHENQKDGWTEVHCKGVMMRLEKNMFPRLGNSSIKDITAPELLDAIRLIEKRGALDVAQRCLQTSGQIFRYAIATGRAERDPSRDLRGALKTAKVKNRAYIKPDELPDFYTKLEKADLHALTKLALHFLIHTFVRSGELRGAKWDEFNIVKAEWRIPAERMKMKEEHIVPLSAQALALLEEIKVYSSDAEYVFPQQQRRNKIMSENTLLYALYRMGYHSRATAHGFRSTASTALNEQGFRREVIETQLAHSERNKVRAAYNHAQYLSERREMMQWWSDYVDRAR
jgi:integrase